MTVMIKHHRAMELIEGFKAEIEAEIEQRLLDPEFLRHLQAVQDVSIREAMLRERTSAVIRSIRDGERALEVKMAAHSVDVDDQGNETRAT